MGRSLWALVNGTFLGGVIAHCVTVLPWVTGIGAAVIPSVLLFKGWTVFGSILLGLSSIQYLVKIPKWPAFDEWLMNLSPRSYYKKCTLTMHKKDIRSTKVNGVGMLLRTTL